MFTLGNIFGKHKNIIKNGDEVEYLSENKHRPSGNPTAYGGMKGICEDLKEDGTFCIKNENYTLIVGGNYMHSVWINVNGKRVKHYIDGR